MDLSILIFVLVIIALAKGLGEALTRLNQPPIVGELLAGIVLGPFLLGQVFHELDAVYTSQFVADLADLGMLFLMLYVGLEFSPKLIKASSWHGVMIAGFGIILPMALALVVCSAFGLSGLLLFFISIAVSVTALPVTIRVLKDMGVMNTGTGATIVSAALVTDVGLLLALGVVLGSYESGYGLSSAAYLALAFLGFFILALLFGKYVVPHIYGMLKRMRTGEAAFAVAVGIAIAFAVLAEWSGLPGVIGAFIAGILLRQTGTGLKVWARVEDILSGVTLGFLAPIFFVLIGIKVDFEGIIGYLPLLAVLVLIAVLGKLVGSYLPARAMRLGRNRSMAIGSMMMGKGAMELVFANIALEMGLIDEAHQYLFSLLVLMAFISTILAPIFFKVFYNRAITTGEIDAAESTLAATNADPTQ
jgi:Kef-type K+ transport system membrane component KefB